jgi:hypothetical protein
MIVLQVKLMPLTNQTNATMETLPKNWVHCGATNPPAWPSPHRVVPTDCWCANATRPPNKVANAGRRKPIRRRIPTRSYLTEQSRGASHRSGTMRHEVEEEGCEIKEEVGAGWRWVTLCSASLGL